jgi:ENTS family enterobactin (siderophore) exporter
LADGTPETTPPRSKGSFRRRARAAVVDVSAIRQDPRFRRLWIGMVLSEFGRQVIIIAMPFEVYVRTGSTLAVGLLAAVELAALLTLSLPAGLLADQLDRRRLLLVTQSILVVCALALAASAAIPAAPIAIVYVVAFVLFAAGAVDRPARKATMFSIVRRDLLNSAVAIDQASTQMASVAGPALGGLVIGAFGLPPAFAMAVAGFGVMIVALLGLPATISPASAPMRRIQGIRDGLTFVRRRPVILSTMAMDFTAMVFGFPSALFPALAISVFQVGAPGYGLLSGAPAAGALISSFLSGSLTAMHRKGVGVVTFFTLWGVAITLFGLAAFLVSFPFAVLCLAFAGAFDIAAAVLRASIVQVNTPDEMRGRVASINVLAAQTGPRLGDLEATTVASLTSVAFSIVSGGLLCILGTLLVARQFPALRAYHDPTRGPDHAGAAPPT